MVRGQVQAGRSPSQVLLPVGQLPVENFAGQKIALPHRIVGVLHRQFRQRRGAVRSKGFVQRRQFLQQHAQRPAIADDVMGIQNQDVIVFRQPEQRRPHAAGPPVRSNGRALLPVPAAGLPPRGSASGSELRSSRPAAAR